VESSLLSRADAVLGDGVEAAVKLKHRVRLRRLGWSRALDPEGPELWSRGEPAPRPGCSVQVLIDGAQALPEIAAALQSAERYVHMTGWHVAPAFELVRGESPIVLGRLLAELAERIDVRILVWAGAPVPATAGTASTPPPMWPGAVWAGTTSPRAWRGRWSPTWITTSGCAGTS
jgi:hypothetical protein